MIRRNYRDLVGASSDRKWRQAFPRHWHACQCQWQRGSRHAFRPIFYPLSFCRSCLTIYLVFQTSYVITLARTWAERGRSQPPGISGVLIDISVRAFSARRSAAARIKVDKGRKDLVESQPSRLWNEILTKKFFELKSLYLSRKTAISFHRYNCPYYFANCPCRRYVQKDINQNGTVHFFLVKGPYM